jgi:hypothetical protein
MRRRDFIRTLLAGATASALLGGIAEDAQEDEELDQCVPEFMLVQPMTAPTSLIFFMEFKYGV